MTDDRMALVELLQKSGDGDFLRAVAEAVLQILMETDVEGLIGAGGNGAGAAHQEDSGCQSGRPKSWADRSITR
jgi:putative transposase